MFLFARCLHLHSLLRRAIDMSSILLPQRTHWRTKSMTQRSNHPPQDAQILNYWPPRAKNSCESTTSPCGSQILNWLFASTGEELVWKYRVRWFHCRVIRFNERCPFWIPYSKLTIFSHILLKPASCSRQFTQNTDTTILEQWIYKSSQTQIDLFPFVTLMNDYKSK